MKLNYDMYKFDQKIKQRSSCSFLFVVHFVAKRYILQQKCLKGQIGTCLLGTRWCNF